MWMRSSLKTTSAGSGIRPIVVVVPIGDEHGVASAIEADRGGLEDLVRRPAAKRLHPEPVRHGRQDLRPKPPRDRARTNDELDLTDGHVVAEDHWIEHP